MNGRTVVTIRMDGFQRDIELPEALRSGRSACSFWNF